MMGILKEDKLSIGSIIAKISKNKLDFNAEYQRNYVWTNLQSQTFIESLFLGYDVPKIYFAEYPNQTNKITEVVDGQQRLKTIYHFNQNQFATSSETNFNGKNIGKKTFDELPDDAQEYFLEFQLTLVKLIDFDEETIKDMFWRYQMGEPLNAAEKRRSLPGNFVTVVSELANNKFFNIVGFDNNRFGYEDAASKVLQQRLIGITSMTPDKLIKTYKDFSGITIDNKSVKEVIAGMKFIYDGFKNKNSNEPNPSLKKWAVYTLTEIACNFKRDYQSSSDWNVKFTNAFINFLGELHSNSKKQPEDQDSVLTAFSDATRGDSPANQEYRYTKLYSNIISQIRPIPIDAKRLFTKEEKQALLYLNNFQCALCNVKVNLDTSEADHITPHTKGGHTILSNGQILCVPCNRNKGAK
jgi:5-methylcytosine-specific restriction endonuclease McrA